MLTTAALLLSAPLLLPTRTAPFQDLFEIPRQDPRILDVLAVQDIDQDGDPDVLAPIPALASTEYLGLTWMLNDGTGGLSAAPFSLFEYPILPIGIPNQIDYLDTAPLTGDLDGDGNDDILFTRVVPGPGTFSPEEVSFGAFFGDGTGASSSEWFEDPVPALEILPIAIGQADTDPAEELLIRARAAGVSRYEWLKWNGNGFDSLTSLPIVGLGEPPTTGDFDSNGQLDLARLSDDFQNILIESTIGGALIQTAQLPVPPPVQDEQTRLASGDFDGDGDVDLVHFGWDDEAPRGFVRWLENQAGTFVQHPVQGQLEEGALELVERGYTYPSASGAGVDLMVVDANGLHEHYPFQPGGVFTAGESVLLDSVTWANPTPVDLNGDGQLDLLGLFFQLGDGSPPGLPPVPSSGYALLSNRIVDLDGDGDLDAVRPPVAAGVTSAVAISLGDGTHVSFAQEFPLPPQQPGGVASYSDLIAQADFDGDGALEVLVEWRVVGEGTTTLVARETHLLEIDGAGDWVDVGPASAGSLAQPGELIPVPPPYFDPFGLAQRAPHGTGDVDGDGDLDLLVPEGIWLNDGQGFFSLSTLAFEPPSFAFLRAMDAADVDGDGDQDLLAIRLVFEDIDSDLRTFELLRREGSGFTSEVLAVDEEVSNWVGQAAFRDLDADGDPDLLGLGRDLLWSVNEGGSFPGPVRREQANLGDLSEVFSGDASGDGTPDLVFLRPNLSRVVAHLRLAGPGLFFAPVANYLPPPSGFPSGVYDVDQDGDVDLVGAGFIPGSAADPAASGSISQYGTGQPAPGPGDALLGAKGPLQSGSSAELRLSRVEQGGLAFLLPGFAATSLSDTPLPGLNQLVVGASFLGPFPVAPASGLPGDGELRLPIPTGPFLAGLELFVQAFVAGNGVEASNGLRLKFGA